MDAASPLFDTVVEVNPRCLEGQNFGSYQKLCSVDVVVASRIEENPLCDQ
jgi:hypothetical protein